MTLVISEGAQNVRWRKPCINKIILLSHGHRLSLLIALREHEQTDHSGVAVYCIKNSVHILVHWYTKAHFKDCNFQKEDSKNVHASNGSTGIDFFGPYL